MNIAAITSSNKELKRFATGSLVLAIVAGMMAVAAAHAAIAATFISGPWNPAIACSILSWFGVMCLLLAIKCASLAVESISQMR